MSTARPTLPARVAAPLRLQVVELLRDALAAGEYAPGQRLGERELCDLYQVSRTVVREALRHLEAEGLVTMIPGQGPVVATVTPEEAESLFEVRVALEALAGEACAVRATPEQKRILRESVDDVEQAMAIGELTEVLASKDRFYAALLDGAGNAFAAQTLRNLHTRIQQLRGVSLGSPGRFSASLAELRAIVDAIDRGDREVARLACRHHVENAAVAAMSQLT